MSTTLAYWWRLLRVEARWVAEQVGYVVGALVAALVLASCTVRVSGHPVAGSSPSADTASMGTATALNAASDTGFTVTSAYPQCVQDTQEYLAYLETGQPPSLDLQYGNEREYVQHLTGDTRRIELAKLSDRHVRACELQARTDEARRVAGHDPAVAPKEEAFCARVGGRWVFDQDCDVIYTITPGSGWAPWSQTYKVKFDADGDPAGDRSGCPDESWHVDTHICTA